MGKMKVKFVQCKISGSLVISDPKNDIANFPYFTEDIFDSKFVPKCADVDLFPKIYNMIF